jgi:hypothetical protein
MDFIKKNKLKDIKFDVSKKSRSRNLMPHFPMNEDRPPHRWLLTLPFEGGSESYWITSARPSMTSERHELRGGMFQYEQPILRQTWDDLYFEIRDYIGENSESKLMEWMREFSHTVTGRQGYGGDRRKNVTVEMLDPTGVAIEKWNLIGCTPMEFRFHENFEGSTIIGVSLSINHATLIA